MVVLRSKAVPIAIFIHYLCFYTPVNSMGSTMMKPITLELKIPQTEATNTSQNVTIEAIVLGIVTTESTIISKQTLLPSTILRIVPTYSTNISEKTTSQSTILGIVPTDTRTVSQQVTSKATVREADQSQTSTIAITSTKVTTSLPQTQHVTSLNKEGTTVNTHASYSFTTNDITVSPVTPGVTTSKVKKNLVFDGRQSTNYRLGLYLIICASVPSALLLISIAVFCAIYHKKVKSSKWQKGSSEEILERQETRSVFYSKYNNRREVEQVGSKKVWYNTADKPQIPRREEKQVNLNWDKRNTNPIYYSSEELLLSQMPSRPTTPDVNASRTPPKKCIGPYAVVDFCTKPKKTCDNPLYESFENRLEDILTRKTLYGGPPSDPKNIV